MLSFAITLACGVMLVYALLLTLVTLSFWFVRIDNIMAIFWAFTGAGRFSIDPYPGWLRFTLATVVPIASTAIAVAAASWFWRLGLRNYTGASA